jgi:voltage-gated sodium channel
MTFWEKIVSAADLIIAMCIVANGLTFGLQTEYQAAYTTDTVPVVYGYLEVIFCIIFTTELTVRIGKHKWRFYSVVGWKWNVFDSVVVLLQLFDVFSELSNHSPEYSKNADTSFLRLLRILRLLRVLRLVRLLQFLGDLNAVANAVYGSLKSLFGTCLMLFLLIYVVGIVFCQTSTNHRITMKDVEMTPDAEKLLEELRLWWGSLPRSMLSLYESILGGLDWNEAVVPITGVNVFFGFLFLFYIAFVLLAMMNVITGIFVDSAIKQAQALKDREFTCHTRSLFKQYERIAEDGLTKEQFAQCMLDPGMQKYMEDLNIERNDAITLFDFIDDDHSGTVNPQELVNGLVKLRAGAKFIDIMEMLHEVEQHKGLTMTLVGRIEDFVTGVQDSLQEVRASVDRPEPEAPSPNLPTIITNSRAGDDHVRKVGLPEPVRPIASTGRMYATNVWVEEIDV